MKAPQAHLLDSVADGYRELKAGMRLNKCRRCGCMRDALQELIALPESDAWEPMARLKEQAAVWLTEMAPIRYTCLGCRRCYPAAAMNRLQGALPPATAPPDRDCGLPEQAHRWPPVPGEYHVLCRHGDCPVAVSTLADAPLATALANAHPPGLCIVGKTETENIGIEKIIKNTITHPVLAYLVVTGTSSEGHCSGQTLLALHRNGVDAHMRVIGSPGKRAVLRNVTPAEVDTFRRQVQLVDRIGIRNVKRIVETIESLYRKARSSTPVCASCSGGTAPPAIPSPPVVEAQPSSKIKLDDRGYFVIIPRPNRRDILAEHYDYDHHLLRTIRGNDARSIYLTIIENGWISRLDHAAYLGKELARAEGCLKSGLPYRQDGA